jgi:hypothetical protein
METQVAPQTKTKVATATKTKVSLDLKTKDETVVAQAIDYNLLNQQEKMLAAKRALIRRDFEPVVKSRGVEDSDGHIHFKRDEVEVVLQKRVKASLNQLLLEELLEKKGLLEKVATKKIVWDIDEERVKEAVAAGLIKPREIEDIFTETISYAMVVSVEEGVSPETDSTIRLRKDLERELKRN